MTTIQATMRQATAQAPILPVSVQLALVRHNAPDVKMILGLNAYGLERFRIEFPTHELDRDMAQDRAWDTIKKAEKIAAANGWDFDELCNRTRRELGLSVDWLNASDQAIFDEYCVRMASVHRQDLIKLVL